jgi:hypothetical protein
LWVLSDKCNFSQIYLFILKKISKSLPLSNKTVLVDVEYQTQGFRQDRVSCVPLSSQAKRRNDECS